MISNFARRGFLKSSASTVAYTAVSALSGTAVATPLDISSIITNPKHPVRTFINMAMLDIGNKVTLPAKLLALPKQSIRDAALRLEKPDVYRALYHFRNWRETTQAKPAPAEDASQLVRYTNHSTDNFTHYPYFLRRYAQILLDKKPVELKSTEEVDSNGQPKGFFSLLNDKEKKIGEIWRPLLKLPNTEAQIQQILKELREEAIRSVGVENFAAAAKAALEAGQNYLHLVTDTAKNHAFALAHNIPSFALSDETPEALVSIAAKLTVGDGTKPATTEELNEKGFLPTQEELLDMLIDPTGEKLEKFLQKRFRIALSYAEEVCARTTRAIDGINHQIKVNAVKKQVESFDECREEISRSIQNNSDKAHYELNRFLEVSSVPNRPRIFKVQPKIDQWDGGSDNRFAEIVPTYLSMQCVAKVSQRMLKKIYGRGLYTTPAAKDGTFYVEAISADAHQIMVMAESIAANKEAAEIKDRAKEIFDKELKQGDENKPAAIAKALQKSSEQCYVRNHHFDTPIQALLKHHEPQQAIDGLLRFVDPAKAAQSSAEKILKERAYKAREADIIAAFGP